MNKLKTLLLSVILLFQNNYIFADMSNRGRLDTDTDSDSSIFFMGITAILIGGVFGYYLLKDIFKNGIGDWDKDSSKFGCVCIILIIVGILGLITAFS